MIKLGQAFLEISNKKGLSNGLNEAKALSIWQEVVGLNIKNNTRPHKIKYGILFVSAKSPAWAQELKYFEETIKNNINKRLKTNTVKEIRFLIDGFYNLGEETSTDNNDISPNNQKIELSEAEKEFIKNLSTSVKNEDLSDCLEKILIKDIKSKKQRQS